MRQRRLCMGLVGRARNHGVEVGLRQHFTLICVYFKDVERLLGRDPAGVQHRRGRWRHLCFACITQVWHMVYSGNYTILIMLTQR
jgi:hypothetical protein